MRASNKGMNIQEANSRLYGVDFHDLIQNEQHENSFELASEFGLTIKDVKKIKKYLDKS